MNNCCVIGLGYIGLPTAALFAKNGLKVLGVDTNEKIVEIINNGKIHIEEPDLDQMVLSSVKKGLLRASSKPDLADFFIISVPTPIENKKSGIEPNLKFVFDAIYSIIPYLKKGNSIILESTSPVGTTQKILELIYKNTQIKEGEIFVAYCPERVLPGRIIFELQNNARVIGGVDIDSSKKIKPLYQKICSAEIFCTTAEIAELVKISENSFRDLNLAFANELSIICDKLNIDSNELISLANQHPRVNILNPGCGVGGHCIAVDPWFLISQFPNEAKIIKKAREVNINKTKWVVDKIKRFAESKEIKKIGIFGISFKANVGDIRESPALEIIRNLKNDYDLFLCEPNLDMLDGFKLNSIKEVLENSELLVFLVPHDKFKELNIFNKQYLDFCGVIK